MKRMHKRWLAMLLALTMVSSILVPSALAEENTPDAPDSASDTTEITTPTEPTVDPAEPSVDPTEPPVEPVEPPVDPIEPPVEPVEPPVDPTEPPVEPVEPPVDPTEPPVEPVEPPVDPAEPPVEPVQPADKPVSEMTGEEVLEHWNTLETDEAREAFKAQLTPEQLAVIANSSFDPLAPLPVVPPVDGLVYQDMTLAQLFELVMAMEDEAEIEAYLTEMQEKAPIVYEALLVYAQEHMPEPEIPETVVSTEVGPLLPPVTMGRAMFRMNRMLGATQKDDALKMSKTATRNEETGKYDITLEAYTTGQVTGGGTVPVDIVLVLDQSGSMQYDFNGNRAEYKNSRQKAMQDSVKTFIDQIAAKTGNAANHRIAIATFGNEASTISGFSSNYADLKRRIDGLGKSPAGATRIDLGMAQATNIIMGDATAEPRQKVVIVFTDGVPTANNEFNTSIATNAIVSAKNLKDIGVTVYTIGTFAGANPRELYGSASGEQGQEWSSRQIFFFGDFDQGDVPAGNRFLNYLSTNFPQATEIGLRRSVFDILIYVKVTYEIIQDTLSPEHTGYYLTAADAATLADKFGEIADQVVEPDIKLGADSIVRDVISPYFTVSDADQVTLYEAAANADGSFGAEQQTDATATLSKGDAGDKRSMDVIEVTGFDFDANCVTTEAKPNGGGYGKKLVIRITDVAPKAGFFGGAGVPTNADTSGIYTKDNTLVRAFDVPTVNVPIDYEMAAQDQTIYLGQEADLKDTLVYAEGYKPDGWNNAFVQIKYSFTTDASLGIPSCVIEPGATADEATWESRMVTPQACTTYHVACDVNTNNEQGGMDDLEPWRDYRTPTVHVLRPKLAVTAQDVWADYGNEVALAQWGLVQENGAPQVAVSWSDSKHFGISAPTEAVEPTLSDYQFTFTSKDAQAQAGAFTVGDADTDWNVALQSVKIGGKEFVAKQLQNVLAVTPAHTDDKHDFTVAVNRFDLEVTKNVSGTDQVYLPQSFLFDVNNGISFTLGADESKTIKGLLSGKTYTVAEDMSWAWRYTNTSATQEVTGASHDISNQKPTADTQALTFTNKFSNHRWLGSSATAENKFGKK